MSAHNKSKRVDYTKIITQLKQFYRRNYIPMRSCGKCNPAHKNRDWHYLPFYCYECDCTFYQGIKVDI